MTRSIRTAPANVRAVPALLLAVTLLVGCAGSGNAFNQPPSRLSVKQMVVREARNMGIPVPLALAVAHAESNFNARARSHKGARGVMQIMPATARGEYGVAVDRLWNPRVNIRLGLHFLGRLIKRYDGRTDLALSYYNGGSAVGRPGRARVIPATRSYVRKVQQLRRQYRQQLRRGQV
ncbi:MAG: lytic transglycosylase domain-containing protein [Alphaproteobacteria bacterium]